MKSLLSAKQRKLHPQGQVVALLRIARRAEANADWIDELLDRPGDPVYTDPAALFDARTKRDEKRARALAACDEVIRIVQDNPTAGWTSEQRAYCASQEVER